VRPLQPLHTIQADALDEVDTVEHQVAAQVRVAWRALFVAVVWMVCQLRTGSATQVVPGVPLAVVVPAARYAWQVTVSGTNVGIECLLSLSRPISAAFESLPSGLVCLALCPGLDGVGFGFLCRCKLQAALRGAPCLEWSGWRERGCAHLALFGLWLWSQI
jgi:hypothetical protein